MAISRFSTSRLTQGLPKYQTAWDQDSVQQGAIVPLVNYTVTAASSISDITFNNISQDYQDLMIVFNGRRTDAATQANVFIAAYNSSITGSPFGTTVIESDGVNAPTSYRYTTQSSIYAGVIPAASASAGITGTVIGHVLNYKTTWGWKTSLWKYAADTNATGASNNRTGLRVGSTQQLTAVNTVNFSTFNSSIYFAQGTTVTVYGIKASA